MRHQKRPHVLAPATRFSAALGKWRWRAMFVALLLVAIPLTYFAVSKTPANALPCPCNIFGTPTGQGAFVQGGGIEVGFKFKSDLAGYVTGVRFYKQGVMGGTHTGRLWTSGGGSLATATFSETSSGWQEVSFSSPVSITAGTTYVASVTMADGNYIATGNSFTSDFVNSPLTAPSSANAGGNGVFTTTPGSFPGATFNATNYWVDVVYTANLGSSAPTVASTSPATDATGVYLGKNITATFDDAMDPSSISASTFSVVDSSSSPIAGTVSYDTATKTASFTPSSLLNTNETYTATIKGGTGTVAKNMEGLTLASDYSWSFTTVSQDPCPCSLKNDVNPAGATTVDDTANYEIGIKIKPQSNGYITAIRFYKPIISTLSTHTGHIWSSTGTSLATVTFSNESDYGWQEGRLATPLHVTDGQLYVVSYGVPDGVFMRTLNALTTDMTSGPLVAYADGSSQNSATLSGTHNGVFSTTAGNYPDTGGPSYFWVDAVFSSNANFTPPAVKATVPASGSYGVSHTKPITASFDRPMDSSTIDSSTVKLFDANNNLVSGSVSYEDTGHNIKFTPSSPLAYGEVYTAKLSSNVADTSGGSLGAEYSWSFTVGSQLDSDPAHGPGGPILVVTATANKYSPYYAEILHTEGLNYFDVKDVSTVSSSVLNNYNAVVLAEMSLTQSQADMFSSWVSGGGNLIAMRPDKKLAGLLGLSDAGTTRANQYLLVNTSSSPGTGIIGETIQFKGTADNYSLNGATSIATLYSDAATATANPAVTSRSVGSNGGTAAAFTYDLAKAVIGLHQGNQAWAGQERDGSGPKRSNDMFFGAKVGDVQADWVDLNKIHIPQADEQQRLLANVLTEAVKDKKPLPRFWYLPHDYKAAMVLAGDDHNLGNAAGTERVFNNWLNESPTWCSMDDWQCVRASDYNYVGSSLTQSRALQYYNLGFDVADHPQNGCTDFTSYASLGTIFAGDLATWRAKYTGIPNQRTNRFHCYVWSDWDSMARVDADNGIRYDLNYVTYPSSWIGSRPAIITGSGMNMRFTDTNGNILDVRQGVTNFENTVTSASAVSGVLDNATGSNGFYGMFGTHYDMGDNYNQTLFDQAKAHSVPIISSDQALTWLDGRNSSKFTNFTGSNGSFTFDIEAGEGAEGLRAMMPIQDAGGTLSSLKLGSTTVSYQTQQVKGVQYAVFDANPGSYTVTYSDSNVPSNNNSAAGSTSPKTGTKTNTHIFSSNAQGLEQATQQPGAETPAQTSTPGNEKSKEKTFVKEDSSSGAVGKWLLGLGLVAFAGGVFAGVAFARHRHRHRSPSW